MRPFRLAWSGLAAGAMIGCGAKPPVGPTGGDLAVAYSGPSTTDGAILLLVTGAVDGVTAGSGYQVASASAGVNATRVVVTGTITPGVLFTIKVKDVAGSFGAQVEAVADRTTFALNDPASYQATVRK